MDLHPRVRNISLLQIKPLYDNFLNFWMLKLISCNAVYGPLVSETCPVKTLSFTRHTGRSKMKLVYLRCKLNVGLPERRALDREALGQKAVNEPVQTSGQ